VKRFWVIVITVAVSGWLAGSARLAKATHLESGRWVFHPVRGVIFLYYVALCISVTSLIYGFVGPQVDRSLVLLAGAAFMFLCVLSWPKAVFISESGLRQRSWMLSWRNIPWADLRSVEEKKGGAVVVRGSRCKIELSQYHGGRAEFVNQLRKRHANFGHLDASARPHPS
jgi:hypothetical protein